MYIGNSVRQSFSFCHRVEAAIISVLFLHYLQLIIYFCIKTNNSKSQGIAAQMVLQVQLKHLAKEMLVAGEDG